MIVCHEAKNVNLQKYINHLGAKKKTRKIIVTTIIHTKVSTKKSLKGYKKKCNLRLYDS